MLFKCSSLGIFKNLLLYYRIFSLYNYIFDYMLEKKKVIADRTAIRITIQPSVKGNSSCLLHVFSRVTNF